MLREWEDLAFIEHLLSAHSIFFARGPFSHVIQLIRVVCIDNPIL